MSKSVSMESITINTVRQFNQALKFGGVLRKHKKLKDNSIESIRIKSINGISGLINVNASNKYVTAYLPLKNESKVFNAPYFVEYTYE